MTSILKCLFSLVTVAASLSSLLAFGVSWWPLLFIGLALFVAASVYFQSIDYIAILLARVGGVLALLGLALLMLAATVGGSFHLSPSNWLMAGMMLLMALFGLSGFFWGARAAEAISDKD
ncbi:hypothetical protein M0C34_04770 [Agarivorans sp. TSD2052]|uniref:hypothetical protein n=1 Tax=Agarivorans sp. TSD2052 TaxID=2937286 RepID=UPI00200D2026|nr:hypothetical protein [Agarivorans sp. TSD2052]UPW19595.1 hypothetical protein M0C34_04770 [Agarivorans sp. TSD2052]